jgi:hypothetical protein
MKSNKMDCAPETRSTNWKSTEWNKVGHAVNSLQLRIAKAIRKGRLSKLILCILPGGLIRL